MEMTEDFIVNSEKRANFLNQAERKSTKFDVYIESYGVKIRISANRAETFKTLEKILQDRFAGLFPND